MQKCIIVVLIHFSSQHITDITQPTTVSYCDMAKSCRHDGQAVCGVCATNCPCPGVRWFLDECDMYEYNCEQNTDYKKLNCEDTKKSRDNNCRRNIPWPFSWMTTRGGETRDFYRILHNE